MSLREHIFKLDLDVLHSVKRSRIVPGLFKKKLIKTFIRYHFNEPHHYNTLSYKCKQGGEKQHDFINATCKYV